MPPEECGCLAPYDECTQDTDIQPALLSASAASTSLDLFSLLFFWVVCLVYFL